jgi:hypothetical protein
VVEKFAVALAAEVQALRQELRQDIAEELQGTRQERRQDVVEELQGTRQELRQHIAKELKGTRQELRQHIAKELKGTRETLDKVVHMVTVSYLAAYMTRSRKSSCSTSCRRDTAELYQAERVTELGKEAFCCATGRWFPSSKIKAAHIYQLAWNDIEAVSDALCCTLGVASNGCTAGAIVHRQE